jgi:hypothetical protein
MKRVGIAITRTSGQVSQADNGELQEQIADLKPKCGEPCKSKWSRLFA